MKVEDWLTQARRDLSTAKYLLEGRRYKEASLFSQQTAEKSLKALLLKISQEIIKTHDLIKLGRLVSLPKEYEADCEGLSMVYIDARYPDTSKGDYTKKEAQKDINIAMEILRWVENQI